MSANSVFHVVWLLGIYLSIITSKVKCSCDSCRKSLITFVARIWSIFFISGDSFKSAAFSGSTEITLAVILKGGKGDVAWQHAQLFRQKLDDVTTCGLDIIISYRKR